MSLLQDENFDISNHYEMKETIGKGGFGRVRRAIHIPTGETVAIKIMSKAGLGPDLPRVKTEIEAMKMFSHHNVCRLYQVFETKYKYFLVIEYCSGGELFDYIVQKERLPENEARVFFRQIVAAVSYIHRRGYVHRDLKPENILIDADQNLKLIDFGLCAYPKGGMNNHLETCCGSPAYAAPELICGRPYIGSAADIWSMGVLLYCLLNGFLPFDDENQAVLYKKIKAGKYKIPSWLSEKSKRLIGKMLQVNPEDRIEMTDLMNCPWICKDEGIPVEATSKYQRRSYPDNDVITELSVHMKVSRDTMRSEILKWKYNYLTAAYFLLLNKKLRGKPVRLQMSIDSVPKNISFVSKRTPKKNNTPSRFAKRQPLSDNNHKENNNNQISPACHENEMNTRNNNNVHVNYYQRKQQNTGYKWKPTNIEVKKSDFLSENDVIKKERRRTKSMDNNLKENNFALPVSKSNYEALKKAKNINNKIQHTKYPNTTSIKKSNEKLEHTEIINVTVTPPKDQAFSLDSSDDYVASDNGLSIDSSTPNSSTNSPTTPRNFLGFSRILVKRYLKVIKSDKYRKSLDLEAMTEFSRTNNPLSPEKKSWSVDDTLNSPEISNQLKVSSESCSSKRSSRNKMFGSFEKGLDRVRTMLTPSKKKNNFDQPRTMKNSCNISNITTCTDGEKLMAALIEAVKKQNIDHAVKDRFILRCKIYDGSQTKSKLSFKLEVCQVITCNMNSPHGFYGVRRKRLKGDSYLYKKVCQQIISSFPSSVAQ